MTEVIEPVEGGHHVRCMELTERYLADLSALELSQDPDGHRLDPRTAQGAVLSSVAQLVFMASMNAGPLSSPDIAESLAAGLGCVAACAGLGAVAGMPRALNEGFVRGVRQTVELQRREG